MHHSSLPAAFFGNSAVATLRFVSLLTNQIIQTNNATTPLCQAKWGCLCASDY
ncbi:hypothetical protein FD51_GL000759 [Lacticaseibacillus zeae DSM 20178 = KCTC 3804]|uniref:Uncharacterized protein n=1 Tax=Lacticaseibacillus zeae DSM 20178 = KCTC 3804 TaxID=1423816 RepID=A0A0R1EYA6_LACZE|nr:hypothetical protein FD51_GL000759 [Lacticaseibacillus zeae DSM 20178 = KCTC 3804]